MDNVRVSRVLLDISKMFEELAVAMNPTPTPTIWEAFRENIRVINVIHEMSKYDEGLLGKPLEYLVKEYTQESFWRHRNCGRATINYIQEVLRKHGLYLN